MRIDIGFRDQLLGHGETTPDGKVRWTGDTGRFGEVVRYYAEGGLEGDALLKRLVERLRGQWWAVESSPEPQGKHP